MTIYISYFASGLIFATVLLLTIMLWRGRLQGGWLIQALVFSTLWSFYLGFANPDEFNPSNQTFIEILRNTSWIMLLWKLYAHDQGIGKKEFWRQTRLWYFGGFVFLLFLVNVLQSSVYDVGVFLSVSINVLIPFMLVVFCLFMLEQWYRNIVVERRWAVKFLAIGLMVIFGFDFILFSEALLYNRLDPVLWHARGWVGMIMAPLVAVSIARARDWDQAFRLSHQAALYSTGLLLAGVYLLVMAGVGYYLRVFGDGWGNAVQIIFVVLAISFLALLVGSGRVRAILAVWINKHFFSYKYDYRDEWNKANSRLAVLPLNDGYYDQLILALAEPVDSPGGILWALEQNDIVCRASWGCDQRTDIKKIEVQSLIDFSVKQGWVIDLDEYRMFPTRYESLILPGSLLDNQELWIIVPLLHQERLYGLMGLRHPRAERSINWEDHDLMKALGTQVASLIALKDANDSLTEARQFEAYNRLSAFVVHDLKNIVAQLSLVVSNAERHKHNPEFVDDALDTLANAVGRMNRLLSQLRQQSRLNIQSDVFDAAEVAEEVSKHQKDQRPALELVSVEKNIRIKIERERLVSVLCHLVQNAQEATADDGHVGMSLYRDAEQIVFKIKDTGCGMDEFFIRDRLFKPFDTTKGRAGMGIGVYEAQQFIHSNRGRLAVESRIGEGTTFLVMLPAHYDVAEPVNNGIFELEAESER